MVPKLRSRKINLLENVQITHYVKSYNKKHIVFKLDFLKAEKCQCQTMMVEPNDGSFSNLVIYLDVQEERNHTR